MDIETVTLLRHDGRSLSCNVISNFPNKACTPRQPVQSSLTPTRTPGVSDLPLRRKRCSVDADVPRQVLRRPGPDAQQVHDATTFFKDVTEATLLPYSLAPANPSLLVARLCNVCFIGIATCSCLHEVGVRPRSPLLHPHVRLTLLTSSGSVRLPV